MKLTSIDRRGFIAAAGGGVVAAASVTSPASAAAPSDLYLAYLAAHKEMRDRCECETPPDDEELDVLIDAEWEAIRALMHRTPSTWQDVLELAGVVRDKVLPDWMGNGENNVEVRMLEAIFIVAGVPLVPAEPRGWSDEEHEKILAALEAAGAEGAIKTVRCLRERRAEA